MNRVQRPRRRGRTSIGQSMVIFALTALVIFVAVGLAVDAGVSYVAANRAERAAAAAALAGVPYMPSQLSTAKAAGVSAAARNGYVTSGNVTVLVYPVPRGCDAGGSTATCEPNQLGASVSVPVATTFLEIVGFGSHKVTQAATAEYLSTLTLGQPDPHLGSTAANLNTPNNYYLLRHEGWGTPRSEGDAYTPNPGASADVHTLNSINEVNMAAYSGGGFGTLPANGGYSYQVVVPSTVSNARINVYNPAFVPNSSNNYRESDPTFDPSNSAQYAVMEYTLYHVADQFDHSKDVPLSQIIVNPANATDASPTNWYDVVTGNTLNAATTVAFYQNWIDPTLAVYPDAEAGGTHLVTVKASHNVDLGPGTYRLRVDTRDGTGAGGSTSAIPINSGGAHKGYALRVMSGAAECAACTLGALNELAFYTPVTSAAGSFEIPIVQVPKTYAGQTINVYAFDPGDVGRATVTTCGNAG